MLPMVEQSFDMHNIHIKPVVFKVYASDYTHAEMAYRKETAINFWNHNLPTVSRIQL